MGSEISPEAPYGIAEAEFREVKAKRYPKDIRRTAVNMVLDFSEHVGDGKYRVRRGGWEKALKAFGMNHLTLWRWVKADAPQIVLRTRRRVIKVEQQELL